MIVHPSVSRRVRDAIFASCDLPKDADTMAIRWTPLVDHQVWLDMANAAISACRGDAESIALLLDDLRGYMVHPAAYEESELEANARQAAEWLRIGMQPDQSAINELCTVVRSAMVHFDDFLSSSAVRPYLTETDRLEGLELLARMKAALRWCR